MRHVCTNERGIWKSLLFMWIVHEMWASGQEKLNHHSFIADLFIFN